MQQDQTGQTGASVVRAADVVARRERSFDLRPDAATRAAMAQALGIEALEALRFKGTLRPAGRTDVTLEAWLSARAVQACVVTLAPVTTVVDATVRRRYVADPEIPEGDEVPMPEDDSEEPLPELIDLLAVASEALALELPDYPRAEGAGLGEVHFGPPGTAPVEDDIPRPFAALAALKLGRTGDEGGGEGDGGGA